MNIALNLNLLNQSELEEMNEFFRDVLGIDPIENPEELAQPDVRGRFKIEDLEQANWALRKLAALGAQQAEIENLAKAEIERIKQWETRKLAGITQSMKFFNVMLEEYAIGRRAADPKFKSETTPYGKIGFRKQQPEWKYDSEEKAAEFLDGIEEMKTHVKTEKKIANKTKFKKVVDVKQNIFVKDGEVIDVAANSELLENGSIRFLGMEYTAEVSEDKVVIMDNDTAEICEGVEFKSMAVIAHGSYVVPGITVESRPDAIDVKPEV